MKCFYLSPDFNSEEHENEPMKNTVVDITSDATGKEELSFRSPYQQQMSKDPLQELPLAKHSQCVLPTQNLVNITGSVARAADNTSHGERPNRYLC